jgi:pimeloyl-ACP methyl ester carboxylesterase
MMQVDFRTTSVVTPDGRDLLVESTGDPKGRSLLFHNGTPTSRKIFQDMAEEANYRGAHLICYDRPGYGGSTPQPGRTVADSARDVSTIANHFEITQMAVWGISGGGPHTIAAAMSLPDLVCAAATFASLAPFTSSNFDYFEVVPERKRNQRNLYFSDPIGFREYLRESRMEILSATEDFLAAKLEAMPAEARVSKSFYQFSYDTMRLAVEDGIEGYLEDYKAFFSEWEIDFSSNTTPIQLWHGQGDIDVPFQHSQWLSRVIPQSELHLTQTDGHFSILENHRVEVMEWLLAHF